MLATLIDKPFDNIDWVFEIKWDGYRALAYVDSKHVELLSRNQLSFNHQFPAIVEALKKFPKSAIFDGEVVVVDEQGKSNFEWLKNYQNTPTGYLCYYVFDLIYYDGSDLREEPLIERKKILKDLLSSFHSPLIRYSDHVETQGVRFFQEAAKKSLEGVIGKKKESIYQSKRSRDWVKIKTSLRQEVVIGGYTQPRGARKNFGALLLGVYKHGDLEYIGHVGTGFTETNLKEIYQKMQPLITSKSPFKNPPKPNQPVTWIKPQLVAEINFSEWTKAKIARQPSFIGLRMDKKAKEVVKEKPQKLNEEPTLTSLDKLYWPKESITKGDMLTYYRTVAPYILPYLKNHPLMLHRYPNGIEGNSFYQKNMDTAPSWIETAEIAHSTKNVHYVLVQNIETLLYVANLGSIELHPMTAQVDSLDYPDFLVIDLDPLEVPFKKVIECALEVHALLDELKIPHYCKTSGGTGLHIYIPLHHRYSFSQTEPFALLLAHLVQERLPKIISLERMPAKRKGKVYFDYVQTGHGGRTMVAPYSLRARPHAPVSTPLKWSEVNDRLDPLAFNIHTVPNRLKKEGDLFKETLTKTIDLEKIIKKIDKLA